MMILSRPLSFIIVFWLCNLRRVFNLQIIELDHELGPQTPFFPDDVSEPFQLKVLEAGYRYGFWFAQNQFTSMELMGTQVTSPYSFDPNGRKINEIPIENLFATVARIDVRSKASNNASYVISVDDVTKWLEENGMFPRKCIVLFNTAWDEGRYPDQVAYFGSNSTLSQTRYPGLSIDALEFILEYEYSHGINFVGFGSDTPILDSGPSSEFLIGRRIASADKYGVYNLKNLKLLPQKGAKIMIMPIRITNGTAAPARVVARLP